MLICLDCGHIFDEEDVVVWKEDRGEYWGTPCYEEFSVCPICKGNYVETYKCVACNEWIDGTYIKTSDGERYCSGCYQEYELGEE